MTFSDTRLMYEDLTKESVIPINWDNLEERWNKAIETVQNTPIPNKPGTLVEKGEKHGEHPLKSYEMELGEEQGFEMRLYYSICQECGIVWNKRVVLFNSFPPIVYVHWSTKRGQTPEEERIRQIMIS